MYSGRDRWVYYIKKDYDASQIAPEWYVEMYTLAYICSFNSQNIS